MRRIAVSVQGTDGELKVDDHSWPVNRVTFSSEGLLKQVATVPQVVNNGPDGKGQVVVKDDQNCSGSSEPEAKRART
eukprot:SAG31_NODE_4118_length_3565_cov_2.083670_3_plen_77_part_00